MARIETIADIEALERVPLAERGLPSSTLAWIEQGVAAVPDDHLALRFFVGERGYLRPFDLTYPQLLGEIRRAANLLHDCGIGSDDVVSLLLPNLPETFAMLFGAEAAGIANPVNPMLEPDVIAEIMNAAGSKALVTLAPIPKADIWEKAEIVRRQVPTLETVIRVDLARYLPFVKRAALAMLRLRQSRADDVPGQRVLDLAEAAAEQPADRLTFERSISGGDIASLFHTGGTTGVPKLAQHTHANEVFDAWALTEVLDVRDDQVVLCGLPLFHVNGVVVTGLGPFGRGQTVVLASPQGYRGVGVVSDFWRIVEHFGINTFSGVPTVYAALSQSPRNRADISSLEYAGCGAAPMPPALFQHFEESTGIRILEGYGLTEGACASAVNPLYGERRVGSVGLRLPYQQLASLQLDEHGAYLRHSETDEIGAIALRGPNVMPGYRHEDHEGGVWIDAGDGGEGWLNTGDLGRIDADGYVWLTGRRKELIIRGGHNIDPAQIEEALVQHAAVTLAAAVGRPDPLVGELPVAYVTLREEMNVSEADLLEHARSRIGERAAVPKQVHIVDELPLTAIGKVFKPALRRAEIESVVRAELAGIEGIASSELRVVSDERHGDLARVRIVPAPDADADGVLEWTRTRLADFAFASEVRLRS